MQRYFVNKKENDYLFLNKDDTNHVTKVMRMKLFDNVEIVYDNHLYFCEILSFDPSVKCKIIEEIKESSYEIPHVIIAQALVKEQKMDYVLQKSCELGAYSIIPFSATRSLIKLDEKDNKKIERWNKILKEASEQCKRVDIPILDEIMSFKKLNSLSIKHKFFCSVNEKTKTIKSVLSNVNIGDTIIFVIGPEGGFTEKEEETMINSGFIPISLGQNVLRTETASSFILSSACYEFMR